MSDDKSQNAATGKGDLSETDATVNQESASTTNPSNVHTDEEQKKIVVSGDDIAKQQSRSTVAVKPGAFAARNISSGESMNPRIGKFESDILAKQRAQAPSLEQGVDVKQKMRVASVDGAKPGAYSTSAFSSSTNIINTVHDAEADILAKQRAGASKNVLSTLEQDIAAKQQGRRTNEAPSKPGATTIDSFGSNINPKLRSIEADIEAKQRAGASHPKFPTSTPGAQSSTSTSANVSTTTRDIVSNESTKLSYRNAREGTEASELVDDTKTTDRKLKAGLAIQQAASAPDGLSSQRDENGAVNVNGTKHDDQSKGALTQTALPSGMTSVDANGKSSKKGGQSQSALNQANLNDLEYGEYGGDGAEGLAVAFAVEEDNTDTYLPSAVEFDPDAKPSMYRNRRFRLYVCLFFAVALVGAIGAVLGIVLAAQELPPESVPYRTTLGIRENLALIVRPDQLDDYTSPYKKALDWVTFTDPMALTPASSQFLNRYVLAYLYYATSLKKPWTSDCAPSESKPNNCIHVFVKDAVEQSVVNRTSFRWFSNANECDWAGIYCDKFNQIRFIELSNVGMSGTFPEGLALLPFLEELDFRYNELDGTLPAYVANWKNLVDFGLQHCAFTGSIPDLWFESRSWTNLAVVGNQVTGTLSSNFSKLEDLTSLELTGNKLTGTLTSEIGELANLQFLELGSNELNGLIPSAIGKLANLVSMDLSRNSITGTIPEGISGCTALLDLFLYQNLLTGPLPQSFWDMIMLTYVSIGGNMLTGTISNRISKFSLLREFEIENNQFNGSFPFRFGNTEVWTIRAYGNKFDGNISTEVCKLIENGQIDDLEFDCAVPLGGGAPEIFCPDDCCTVCCNPDGEECVEV